ncbi:MAG: hypothetical protein D8M58_03435 [Calditrichaeota bacterium]|nr:MAG: hypothetical protein DWQ03_03640 [Calditrichota bacterium]MBL1204419.1 hypothetical protein [Calditrichota bacterium]NOG44248.1 sulfotransferase family 2 domain-containing protein [Calditrichota bacterium]
MLISHRKKFIYTKTSKTAGTSVESYFEKFCMPEGEWEFSHGREEYISATGIIGFRGTNAASKEWRNHLSAAEIKNKIGASIWDNYFKFCVVRNPFDKLLSGFFFNKEKNEDQDTILQFRNWLKNGGRVMDRDRYVIGDNICMDYFIKYENLEEGINHVCKKLELPFEPSTIPKLKTGYRKKTIPINKFYDEESIQLVKSAYSFELNYFNYSMPEN